MTEFNIQQKQFIQEYKASHHLENKSDEQIMLFIQKDMQKNGVVYPGFEHLANPNTSASSTANGQIFDTSNKSDENKGISVEKSSTTETSDNLPSEGKEVTTDENGNTITTIKDGDDIIEQTISSTDEKGNNIETVVNYQDGKPIKQTKKKNGNIDTVTAYKYHDASEENKLAYVTLETTKADNTKVITTALETDKYGNVDQEDFISRKTISRDGTETTVIIGSEYIKEEKLKFDGKKVTTLYKGTNLADFDSHKLHRVVQETEVDGIKRYAEYDGKGNTKTTVQFGETPSKIAKKFNVKEQALMRLNPQKGKNAITQVGADILIPGEFNADSYPMRVRKSKAESINKYNQFESKRLINEINSGEVKNVKLAKSYNNVYEFAKDRLLKSGVKNPDNNQINEEANKLILLNGKDFSYKTGKTVKIAKSLTESKPAQELTKYGFKASAENRIFFQKFNNLNSQQKQNVLSAIQYCKSQKITNPSDIKAKVLETLGINLFDSNKTVPMVADNNYGVMAYQRNSKPISIETFVKDRLKLDIKSDLGKTVLDRLSQVDQAQLNKISAKDFKGISNKTLDGVASMLETVGVQIRTQAEINVKNNSPRAKAEKEKRAVRIAAAENIALAYDNAINVIKNYQGNQGWMNVAFYREKLGQLLDKVNPTDVATCFDAVIKRLEKEKQYAVSRLKTASANESEFRQAFKDLTGKDYNENSVKNFIAQAQKGGDWTKAYDKAFGDRVVKRATDKVNFQQYVDGAGDIVLMLLGTEAIGKGVAWAGSKVATKLAPYVPKVLSKIGTATVMNVGGNSVTVSRVAGSMVTSAATFTTWDASKNYINLKTKDIQYSGEDAVKEWQAYKEGNVESGKFGAFAGLLNSTVVGKVVSGTMKLFEKPVAKAVQGVAKTLEKGEAVTGTEVMKTFIAKQAPGMVAKTAGAVAEVAGFTMYETANEITKELLKTDANGQRHLPKDLTEEGLTNYLWKHLKGQAANLGEIKAISKLIFMHKGAIAERERMMNENLSKCEMLSNVKVQKAEVGGVEIYAITTPNGNRKIARSPEDVVAYCNILMQMDMAANSMVASNEVGQNETKVQIKKSIQSNPVEQSLQDKIGNATTREAFVAIRDEIKKLPNSEEKMQLMQEYLKKYSEWSSDPKRPDIRMQYKPTDAPLNQNSEEIRTMITNAITRLKKTSSGEDVTLKINGEERVFQAYKGNVGNNGGYCVTDGESIYTLSPKPSKALCQEELLADELYCQIMGCLPKEKVVVETDSGFAVMTKSVFNKGGFQKSKDAIVQTYGMDALLGNVDNIALVSKGNNPVLISNNSSINLRRTRNGFFEGQNAVYQLAEAFDVQQGLTKGSKNALEMRKASKEELISSLQKVVNLPDEKLIEIVNNSEIENKEALGKILVGRKHFITKFLENLKNVEQEGLPIEEFVRKIYQKTYGENKYEKLKENTTTEFTDYISEKFNISEFELLEYQRILNNPELASHIKEKIEDGTLTKEDLIEFNRDIGKYGAYWQEGANDKVVIFNAILDLNKNNGMAMKEAYPLILKYAQGKDGSIVSERILNNIKEINQELGGNTNSVLFQKLFIDIQTCEIDRTKLDIVKDLKNKGIEDKHLILLLETISNPDGTINVEKQKALNELFEHNTSPEDIPMYFAAVNTPNGFDSNMKLIVDRYKELGLDNDTITNMVLSSRVNTAEGGKQQRTHALEIPLLFHEELSNRRLLNDAIGELRLWTPNVEDHIKKVIEKNPNIKLADLIPMLRSFHKDRTFDQQGYSMAFRLLEDGVSPSGMGSFVAATKVTPRQLNGLTTEEAASQTTKLRDVGEYLLDNEYTTDQVYKLIEVAKTNGKIDDFILNLIQNNSSKYNANDLLLLIRYSKVMPSKDVSVESVNSQRQQIFDTMTDLMQNKGYSAIDAGKSIVQALYIQRVMMSSMVTGLNTNTLEFCKKCTDNNIPVDEVQLLAYNSKIIDNISGFTPEEIKAKQQVMLNWADKLLFEAKLPPKTVAKFMEIAAFKSNRGKVGIRPVTFNFDENVINVINRMVEEKAITPESDANISQVILGFKLLDYDETAINTTMKLLKNPITLENGKQYDLDADFLGNIIAGSRDPKTNKFDIDKFNKNVQLYILKADHGFSLKEMVTLAKLYKGDITIDRLSTGQKVNLLNKISYASKDAIKLIQDKVIDTKDANGNPVSGDVELLTQKLLTDINLASKNIRTNQTQRQEFLRNFISNKGKNPETGLNDIETKISEFDFTQYGKEGLPLQYSRNEFIANIREILADLSPEEQASVLRFHNIDLGENGFNSNPRIKRINQSVEQLTNEGYKNVIDELSTILKGVNEDNLQLYKENNIETILTKCTQLSQLNETQIAELARDYPELNIEDIKTLQTQAREFAELVANNNVSNLPTPLAVKTANEEIEGFNQFTDKMKSASARIEQEYNKFIYENEFKTGDAELDNILNGIMRGLPDVMLTVGKQQHKTHAYSVDVHTMEVLKKAMNDPEYKTLSDKDRTILKFSILLHDFGKKFINPETPDTGHEIDSAEIASGIMAQFKLPATVKERILNIIKNHDWFARYNRNEWNANKVAALFRSPDDYKIAKIMSKADLFSINPEFQYNPNVLNIKEDKTIEHASRVFDEKLKNLDVAYNKMYAKTNIVMNSKILNPSKIPMDEKYGVRVLNLTDESIPSDMNLGQYGMNGTTKDNLRLTIHMVAEDNLLGNLESAKLGMESTTNDNNVWSISMIKMDRTRTYMHREYGFATDTPISSIAIASPNNLSSGYEKGVDKFVELLFTDNLQRNFLKQKFMMSAQALGKRITEADYQELSRLVYNKQFLSQLETKSKIEVNGNIYPTSIIVKAIQESTDALFTGQTHTEFVVTNPKIQGLVARKSSMDEVAPDFIAFAKKYNLPILLVGNK